MGRRATGRVEEREGVFSIRVPHRGQRPRITLGTRSEGWTPQRAADKLEDVMAALRLGVDLDDLFPSAPTLIEPDARNEPTIGRLIDDYLADRVGQVAPKTLEADEWALRGHIAPYFGRVTPSDIGVEHVDAFRRHKIRERELLVARAEAGRPAMETRSMVRDGRTIVWQQRRRPLSDAQINRLIDQLATLLDVAMERRDVAISANVARGKRRKIKVRQPSHRSYLEPEQVWALLDAAEELEAAARRAVGVRALPRRAIIATLIMGGERISELVYTGRPDVNLGARTIRVAMSKTDAGYRVVDVIFDVLVDILRDYLARHDDPAGLLFPAYGGGALSPDNVRRMIEETVERANELCVTRSIPLIGECTPHTLRRTNISLLAAAGGDPAWIMEQVGHTDPKLTLRIYTQVLKRQRSKEYRARANELLGASAPGFRPKYRPNGDSAQVLALAG